MWWGVQLSQKDSQQMLRHVLHVLDHALRTEPALMEKASALSAQYATVHKVQERTRRDSHTHIPHLAVQGVHGSSPARSRRRLHHRTPEDKIAAKRGLILGSFPTPTRCPRFLIPSLPESVSSVRPFACLFVQAATVCIACCCAAHGGVWLEKSVRCPPAGETPSLSLPHFE